MVKISKKNLFFAEIVLAATITAAVIIVMMSLRDTDQGIRMVRLRLTLLRARIGDFYQDKCRYPDTLEELVRYAKETRSEVLSLTEYISTNNGVDTEHCVLNGEGGWCYNKSKGELRLNIVRPIKYYKRLYLGKYRNTIPSEW